MFFIVSSIVSPSLYRPRTAKRDMSARGDIEYILRLCIIRMHKSSEGS